MKNKIENILSAKFHPVYILVRDDSELHAGHEEALRSGGGHYSVLIVSDIFAGKKLLERHRMIYAALQDEFKSNIHALKIQASTPQEYSSFPKEF